MKKYVNDEWAALSGYDPIIIKNDKNEKYYIFSTDTVINDKNWK